VPPAPAPERTTVDRVAVAGLFVACLAGRITLDRTGIAAFGALDARLLVLPALAYLLLLRRASRPPGYRHPWPRCVPPMLAVVAVLVVSATWAPAGARVGDRLADLAALAAIVILTAAVTGADPEADIRLVLWLTMAAGLVYAVAAVRGGAGVQGRYTALGSGPNVSARVISEGIVAALALAVATRRPWLLAAVPPLAAALILSGSRGGVAALAATLVVFLWLFRSRLSTARLLAGAGFGAAVCVAVWRWAGGRAATLTDQRYSLALLADSGFSHRMPLLVDARDMWIAHPWRGAGLDSFYAMYGQYIGLGYPHDFPAAVAAEAGAVGLAAVAVCGWRWLRETRPWSRRSADRLGCMALAAYIAVESLFSGDYYDSRFAWYYAVLAVARPAYVAAATHTGRRRPGTGGRV
jgi:O-antigen ligase